MRFRDVVLLSVVLLCAPAVGHSQEPGKSTPASPGALIKSWEEKKFDAAIKTYVEQARKTYPSAKERFLAGLPAKHVFFLTARLHDAQGNWEQVFVEVKEISDGKVKGLIANDIQTVTGFKLGDSYAFLESDMIDWTIILPDGTEEGNVVGKFLDTYKPD